MRGRSRRRRCRQGDSIRARGPHDERHHEESIEDDRNHDHGHRDEHVLTYDGRARHLRNANCDFIVTGNKLAAS